MMDYNTQQHRKRQEEERKPWLKRLTQYVKPGKIVELGCGSGFIVEELSHTFADSSIIGVDKSLQRLAELVKKKITNVIPLKGDFTQPIFASHTFDTAIFVGSLHEVFSYCGPAKVEEALRLAYATVKNDGVVIIQDFLKPSPAPINLIFKNEETKKKFIRFATEFKPRKIQFEIEGKSTHVDVVDAVEFISKYRSPNEDDWRDEMAETHFFFTEKDYRNAAQVAGFFIHDLKKLARRKERAKQIQEDIECNFTLEHPWIQLVLKK
ncbi:MAG: methyltransferase domain-containing protein [candidate division WOR-3 bacterium]|nr:MAG: methyltransferase domain-containing protein [candidate division WOR-3 bacterium]